ncbi:hypothetical protein GUJ93_ZPchr0004g38368 [Zizania palustris]|uniref:Uncharacterized protein n=1 Tax=Zizania palustris TaxID=103762 RepID=A0A8J5VMY3_ZIZPA|nr:hypothetical protein GUJ93_ZPchr0004g38368 [Zizania palustris]
MVARSDLATSSPRPRHALAAAPLHPHHALSSPRHAIAAREGERMREERGATRRDSRGGGTRGRGSKGGDAADGEG